MFSTHWEIHGCSMRLRVSISCPKAQIQTHVRICFTSKYTHIKMWGNSFGAQTTDKCSSAVHKTCGMLSQFFALLPTHNQLWCNSSTVPVIPNPNLLLLLIVMSFLSSVSAFCSVPVIMLQYFLNYCPYWYFAASPHLRIFDCWVLSHQFYFCLFFIA